MADKVQFKDIITKGYSFMGNHFLLGAAMLDGEVLTGTSVFLPLKTNNRH